MSRCERERHQRFQEEGSSAKVCVGAGTQAANPPLLMALPPCGRKVCEVAARIPTQVKLLFATLAYYAVICVVFWQVENWPVLDSIYFATGIMSTVGTGDLFPSEDDGLALVHALTIIFAFSGIVLIPPRGFGREDI